MRSTSIDRRNQSISRSVNRLLATSLDWFSCSTARSLPWLQCPRDRTYVRIETRASQFGGRTARLRSRPARWIAIVRAARTAYESYGFHKQQQRQLQVATNV